MGSWFLTFLALLILGFIAAGTRIAASQPQASQLLSKMRPYRGAIGMAGLVWGIFKLVGVLSAMNIIPTFPVVWLTLLANAGVMIILGFLLGYTMLVDMILSRSDDALRKAERLHLKLAPLESLFGFIALGLSLWMLYLNVILY